MTDPKPYLEHFSYSEFDSPDEPGSGRNMNDDTVVKLDKARSIAGVPFRINSGYRTPEHNKEVGGVKYSAHTRGYAVDISLKGFYDEEILRTIAALAMVGFNRMGAFFEESVFDEDEDKQLFNGFIHVDNDPDKPYEPIGLTTWSY